MPWTGRDIFFLVLVGLALSAVLTLVVVPFVILGGRQSSLFLQIVVLSLLIYAAFAFSAWYFAIKRTGASLAIAGLRPPPRSWVFVLMIPVTVGALAVNFLLVTLMQALFTNVPTGQEQLLPPGVEITPGLFVGLLILTSVAAPIVEEFLFRGILFRWLRSGKGFWFAAPVSSLVFAVAHFIPVLILPLFGLGFVLATVVERTKSLYPAMIVHALNNALAVTLVYMGMQ